VLAVSGFAIVNSGLEDIFRWEVREKPHESLRCASAIMGHLLRDGR
jgi:hypothetical protein